MKYQLNLTALSCPIPLLTAKKALQNCEVGDLLELHLNPASVVENFSLFSQENGAEWMESRWLSSDIFVVTLKKIK